MESKMKKHRVAVIGCGALAQGAHLPSCRKNGRIELVAVCDVNRETAELCKKEFGARRVETDWHKVVEAADIDLCILCTHTNLRGEFIIPALESGKAVYTEKPLAPSRKELLDIVMTSRRTGRPVCVGHNRRSSPAVLEFKRLLDKAKNAGRGFEATVDRMAGRSFLPEEGYTQLLIRVNDDSRSWKHWSIIDEEGMMHAEMVHFIDLSLWFNAPLHPVRIFAEGSPRGNFTILIRFSDGSLTTLQHTSVGHFDYPKELFEAATRNITIAMDQHIEVRQIGIEDEAVRKFFPYATDCEWVKKQGMDGYMREFETELRSSRKEGRPRRWINVIKGHYEHLDRFLDHLEGRGENPCDVESAATVNRIALKVLDSARLGLPVVVNPQDWNIPNLG
jgi:predicted dehydrogenase